jgi:hypothetical protein
MPQREWRLNMPKKSSRQSRTEATPQPEGDSIATANPAGREELIRLIDAAIDRRFTKLFADFESLSPGHGPGRGYTSPEKAVKFTISMSRDLYTQLKGLKGTVSSHVSAAVQLYLSTRKRVNRSENGR